MTFQDWFKKWMQEHPLRVPAEDDARRFTQDVMRQIRTEMAPASSPHPSGLRWPPLTLALPAVAVAAALVVAAALFVTRDRTHSVVRTRAPGAAPELSPPRQIARAPIDVARTPDPGHPLPTERAAATPLQDAETILAIRRELPDASIEVLTSDMGGAPDAQHVVLEAGPDVYNHNVETVRRFQSVIRPQAAYGRSLAVLRRASQWSPAPAVKSGIMLGLGETEEELVETLRDLRSVGCQLLTLGQYLQPTRMHTPVARYVPPEEFDRFGELARELGFVGVASGPMVRSSYKAEELLESLRKADSDVAVV